MTTIKLKNGRTIDVPSFADRAALPLASQEYIWDYGMRQSINDSTAPCVRKSFDPAEWNAWTFEEAVDQCAAKRLDAIMSGTVGTRAPRKTLNPKLQKVFEQLSAMSPAEFDTILEKLGPLGPTAIAA